MKANVKLLIILTTIFLSIPKIVSAQNVISDTVNQCDLYSDADSELFKDETKEDTAVSNQNIAVAGISVPSLWWAREQFDPFGGRLINNWLAYPQLKQIDLTVDWQLWTFLDYLGRYRFLNQFGTVAREYGYDLRVFNQQKQCLGIYEYNPASNPPRWEIKLESSGQDSLQVQPTDN
ncbi:MAG: hypothetical protein QNJ32_21360 [Xenococcaceae cyanobacterium MO_167.B27]|nr:hypothetical protein [Xenococcaceae cyanobacterium MO_167.B27]